MSTRGGTLVPLRQRGVRYRRPRSILRRPAHAPRRPPPFAPVALLLLLCRPPASLRRPARQAPRGRRPRRPHAVRPRRAPIQGGTSARAQTRPAGRGRWPRRRATVVPAGARRSKGPMRRAAVASAPAVATRRRRLRWTRPLCRQGASSSRMSRPPGAMVAPRRPRSRRRRRRNRRRAMQRSARPRGSSSRDWRG
jgi:hypothetical protein